MNKLNKHLAHILVIALVLISAYQIIASLEDVFFLVQQMKRQITMTEFKLFLQKGYLLFLTAGLDLTYALFLLAIPHNAVKIMHLALGLLIFFISLYFSFMVQ
ncbi:hypothetical protein KKD62_03500 [Patescibacteria group bacterium]|nr:hypothetical protein [Patescibacteria group bacterium]MBU1931867.1 hypothetical protein [Patescibacteria group bacterium]